MQISDLSFLEMVRGLGIGLEDLPPASQERRSELLQLMHELGESELSCKSCVGLCCTSEFNSMQVDLLQALDMYYYLKKQGRWNVELETSLTACIKQFRLDKEVSTGTKSFLRRYYTCPFYLEGPRGCTIAPEYKPYGCLGFNAKEKNVSVANKCMSYTNVLERREKKNHKKEFEVIEQLKSKLNIWWDKKNIPQALVELNNVFESGNVKLIAILDAK